MARLPVISGKEAVSVFEKFGWVYARRESSHMILKKAGVFGALSIPDKRQVAEGTLRSQLRVAGIAVEDFISAFQSL